MKIKIFTLFFTGSLLGVQDRASDTSEGQHQAETIRLNIHIAEQDALLMSRNAEVNRLAAELVEVKGSMAAAATRHRNEAATVIVSRRI